MATVLAPDVERLLVAALKAAGEILTLCAGRIYAGLPADKTLPFVTVATIGGQPQDPLAWIDAATVQVSVWGETQNQAWALAATVRAVIADLPAGGSLPEGTVCRAVTTPPVHLPDNTITVAGRPAPRYTLTADLRVHP